MLSDNLVLKDNANADVTFVLLPTSGSDVRRVDNSTPNNAPRDVVIRHSTSGKGADTVDRHNVVFNITKLDSNGVARRSGLSLTFTQPRTAEFDADDVYDNMAFAGSLLTDAVLAQILRGES